MTEAVNRKDRSSHWRWLRRPRCSRSSRAERARRRAQAASHREAPLIALDPTADITDFFMFRSYEPGQPGQGRADHGRRSRARSRAPARTTGTSTRTSSTSSTSTTTGTATRTTSASSSRSGPSRSAACTASSRCRSRMWAARPAADHRARRPRLGRPGPAPALLGDARARPPADAGSPTDLIAVPSNVGPRTMPNYDALAAQGTYDLGERDQGLRRPAGRSVLHRPRRRLRHAEPAARPADRDVRRGRERHREPVRHRHALGLQRPLDRDRAARRHADAATGATPTHDRRLREHEPSRASSVQNGVSATTAESDAGAAARQPARQRGDHRHGRQGPLERARARGGGSRFEDYYLNPRLALALELVFGVPAAKTNRTDLRDLLLKYQPSDTAALGAAAAEPRGPADAARGAEADDRAGATRPTRPAGRTGGARRTTSPTSRSASSAGPTTSRPARPTG